MIEGKRGLFLLFRKKRSNFSSWHYPTSKSFRSLEEETLARRGEVLYFKLLGDEDAEGLRVALLLGKSNSCAIVVWKSFWPSPETCHLEPLGVPVQGTSVRFSVARVPFPVYSQIEHIERRDSKIRFVESPGTSTPDSLARSPCLNIRKGIGEFRYLRTFFV